MSTASDSSSPRALVKRVARFEAANEARDDQTRQRRFERGFLSLDRPDAEGSLHDYGDCGRGARRMLSDLDAPFREQVREARFQRALARLAGHPELQKTLRAIRRFRSREKIISALQIKGETYEKRFRRVRILLQTVT